MLPLIWQEVTVTTSQSPFTSSLSSSLTSRCPRLMCLSVSTFEAAETSAAAASHCEIEHRCCRRKLWLRHPVHTRKVFKSFSARFAFAPLHPPAFFSKVSSIADGDRDMVMCKAQHKGRVGIYTREGNVSLASFGLKLKKDKSGNSLDITKSLSMMLPYIVVATAVIALSNPVSFSWVRKDFYAPLLGGIMLSIGVQLSIADFALIFQKPLPLMIGYAAQYALKPLLGLVVAQAFGVPAPFYSGFILTACVAGAQLSSYAAFLSGGDIALSIILTSLTTISSVIVTPLLTGLLIGSIVPVDVVAMAKSILQVVFLPIFIGLALNSYAKPIMDRLRILMPLLAMVCTSLCIGSPLALNRNRIMCMDGLQLLFPVLAFHAGAFLLGYLISGFPLWRQDRKISRTLSLCTGMQSSTLAMLLATEFLGGTQAVPPACSVVVMAIMGLSLASFWGSAKSKCTYVSKRADLFEGRLYA